MLLHSPNNNNSQNSAAAPQMLLSLVTIQWLFSDIVFAHVFINMICHKFFLLVWIIVKKPKSRLLPTFSPDFTLNRQIWLFYAEKWIFLKSLVLCLKGTKTEKKCCPQIRQHQQDVAAVVF